MNPIDGERAALPDTSQETVVAPAADAAATTAADARFAAKATKAAVQFESFFIAQMLHQMRNSARELADEDSPFKDPVNRDMQDFADTLVADQMAGKRAFGIADVILRQLLPSAATPLVQAAAVSAMTLPDTPKT